MSDHPEITALVDLARGALADDAAAETLAHCRECEQCDTDLAVVLLLRPEGEAAAAAQAHPARAAMRWRRWLALAAMFVLGIAIGVVASRALPGATGWNAGPAEEASAPRASPFPTDVPAQRLAAALAAYDELLLRPALIEGRARGVASAPRGKTDLRDPALAAEALYTLADGRVDEAVQQLEVLHAEDPYDPHIAGYLAIALFHAGERDIRVEDLLLFAMSSNQGETQHVFVRLYLARLYLERGEVDKSLRYLAYIATRPYLDVAGRLGVEILERVQEELAGA